MDLAWFGPSSSRNDAFVAAGDVTGDGKAELFFTPNTSGSASPVYGLKGRASIASALPGGFATVASAASPSSVLLDWTLTNAASNDGLGMRIALGDVDKDGVKDLVVASWNTSSGSPGTLALFWGGPGSLLFSSATTSASAAPVKLLGNHEYLGQSLTLGDLSGDGYADIAASSYDPAWTGGVVQVVLGGTRQ